MGLRFLQEPGSRETVVQVLDVERIKVDPRVAIRFPAPRARRWQVLPFAVSDDRVLVAAADSYLGQAQQVLERCYRQEVVVSLAEPEPLRRVIERVYSAADTLGLDEDRAAGVVGPASGELDAV